MQDPILVQMAHPCTNLMKNVNNVFVVEADGAIVYELAEITGHVFQG